MMRSRGKPEASSATWHIASIGFAKMMMTAFGEAFAASFTFARTMSALPLSRSSRLMPGLRGAPAVQTMTSESFVSSQPSVPVIFESKPSHDADCVMSSALPWCSVPANCGSSWMTTSAMPFSTSRCAIAPPVMPPPITVTFLRAPIPPPSWLCSRPRYPFEAAISCIFAITASATCAVPTAVGSLRSAFMS